MTERKNRAEPLPPIAETRPHTCTHHGITLEDPYHWLKDDAYPKVEDADVLAYLRAENAYFEAMMAPHQALIDTIFAELKGRQQPDDHNVPVREGAYFYQWRFDADGQYRIWSRWPVAPATAAASGDDAAASGDAAASEDAVVILDEPALAADGEYFRLGAFAVSNDACLLAYSTDTSGGERFTLRVKNLYTGALLDDVIENTQGNPVWTADDSAFFYTALDDQWRPYQVRLHRLGEPPTDDIVVYEEHDAGFFVDLSLASSRRYAVIATADHATAETYLIPTDEPEQAPILVVPRRVEHDYRVDHQGDRFVIKTNDTHKNARLVTAPEDDPGEASWRELIPASDERCIQAFQAFADFVAIEERGDGIDKIHLLHRDGSSSYVEFPESVYAASLGDNEEFDSRVLRLDYSSLVTPNTVYDFHIDDAQLCTRKVRRIPSGYDATQYATERLVAPVRDGVGVHISLVYRKDARAAGVAPLYLYGYGAYGHGILPSFSSNILSLLDRGLVFAIAHVRGGDELGYYWYEAGKLMRRTNTFNDFVDVARHLIAEGITEAGRIAIAGGSAGGELMGAVVNQAPELWGAVAAHVPFVDVLNTMLDTSLPLTPIEWPEWGNPLKDKQAFEFIRSYSPYDQLKPGRYPPMLVTAGLNDPRVTYWEPAKYVAKLRTLKQDDTPLLLKTNMGAGHGGRSGRFDALYEVAEEYAFIVSTLGARPA